MINPVILSGGSGTRLWPLSRKLRPKQFLPVHTDKTLFQETILRLHKISTGNLVINDPMVICNNEHRFFVAENARSINLDLDKIILEPVARNTAPAVAVAAITSLKKGDDQVLLVLPADHVIQDTESFKIAVEEGLALANQGNLVTFGVVPTKPHTGYGYIECGDGISDSAFKIRSFKEKPNTETAEEFLAKGGYYWNSGMFMFKASTYIDALNKYAPEVAEHAAESIDNAHKDLDFIRLQEQSFSLCPDISIDYAVMEKTDKAVVVKLEADWCDIGSWGALLEIGDKDEDGNVCRGDIIVKDSKDSYFYGSHKLITAVGVQDLIVVDTKDALLITNRNKSEDVKDIVNSLKEKNRSETMHHRVVYRPWGSYDSICKGPRDQVKRVIVKPGAKLSLQKHMHRSEHWVIVKGTAKITKGDEQFLMSENESTYIPVGTMHSLENPGKIPLEIIEIQTGSYLGEDDIERFEDIYGRVESGDKLTSNDNKFFTSENATTKEVTKLEPASKVKPPIMEPESTVNTPL